jgi:hypothetical protein
MLCDERYRDLAGRPRSDDGVLRIGMPLSWLRYGWCLSSDPRLHLSEVYDLSRRQVSESHLAVRVSSPVSPYYTSLVYRRLRLSGAHSSKKTSGNARALIRSANKGGGSQAGDQVRAIIVRGNSLSGGDTGSAQRRDTWGSGRGLEEELSEGRRIEDRDAGGVFDDYGGRCGGHGRLSHRAIWGHIVISRRQT